jgi:hypothetical protein
MVIQHQNLGTGEMPYPVRRLEVGTGGLRPWDITLNPRFHPRAEVTVKTYRLLLIEETDSPASDTW